MTRREPDAELALLTSGVSDWDAWLQEMRSERLSGAVWTAMRDQDIQSLLPEPVQSRLAHEWERAVEAGSPTNATITDIASALDGEPVHWILLEAPSTLDFLYAPSSLEAADSAMILTRGEDYEKALDLLRAGGWDLREDMAPEFTALGSATFTRKLPVPAELTVRCRLWSPVARPHEDVVWEALEHAELAGRPVRIPGAADRALWRSVSSVLDRTLASTFQTLQVALDFERLDREGWLQLIEHAQRMDVVPELEAGFFACAERMGLKRPPGVAEKAGQALPRGRRARVPALLLNERASAADVTMSRLLLMPNVETRKQYWAMATSPPYGWRALHCSFKPDDVLCGKPFKGFWKALGRLLFGKAGAGQNSRKNR